MSIRTDKHLHADLGIRQNVVNLLLCYNITWLQLGLETIFDTNIVDVNESPNAKIAAVSKFIMQVC